MSLVVLVLFLPCPASACSARKQSTKDAWDKANGATVQLTPCYCDMPQLQRQREQQQAEEPKAQRTL